MTAYALIYVSFDYYRFEDFIGIYGDKQEAISAAIDSDITDNILILEDSELIEQPRYESEARKLKVNRGYFWLHSTEL